MLKEIEGFESGLEAELMDLEQALVLREQAIETRIKILATQWNTHSLPVSPLSKGIQ